MAFSLPTNLVLLSSQTASSSSSIVFTQFTSTFSQYFLTIRALIAATNNSSLLMTVSTNGGSTYLNANYQWVVFNYSSAASTSHSNSTSDSSIGLTPSVSSTTSQAYDGDVKLINMNQSVQCNIQSYGTLIDNGSSNLIFTNSYGMNSTNTAINAVKLAMSSGNISSGVFKLYGLKEP
jgi:hypothetical protein